MGYTGLEHVQYTVHNFRVAQREITKPSSSFAQNTNRTFTTKPLCDPFFMPALRHNASMCY